MKLVGILLFVAYFCCICTKSGFGNSSVNTRAVRFLTQFGYLNLSPESVARAIPVALQSNSELRKAIVTFQRFFQLPITGRLDNATQRLMASSRCGNKDLVKLRTTKRIQKRFSIDKKSTWSKKVLSYKITSYPSSGLSKTRVRIIFRKAFNIWSKAADLSFYEVRNDASNADIVITFGQKEHGDLIPFDGPGNILAHAFYPSFLEQTEYSINGDAHFDDSEVWTDGNDDPRGINLLSAATHELGHSLGLGHSNKSSAIMYPVYNDPTSGVVSLGSDDIEKIQSIYGAAGPKTFHPEVTTKSTTPESTSTRHAHDKSLDICNTAIDSLGQLRGAEVFLFKDEWCWRVQWSRGTNGKYVYKLYNAPFLYKKFWLNLSRIGLTNGIDVMFETSRAQLIYVFRNKRFWILKDNDNLANGFSSRGQPLSSLGLPAFLDKVDAMFVWKRNVYIFAGHLYWRFNEEKGSHGRVVSSPRFISRMWRGLPTPIDAVFTEASGKIYFIKGKQYYKMAERGFTELSNNLPAPMFGCARTPLHTLQTSRNNSSGKLTASFVLCIILSFLVKTTIML